MCRALESEQLAPFDVADINFGCPMPKIFNNGEGSALMENPALAEKIVSECKKSGKAITCKIRTGIKDSDPLAVDFAKAIEQGGADMITVHGRSRERIYAGEVNFDVISKVKQSVNVPVIANGGIFTPADADELSDKTGADGVMIARGALENPGFSPKFFTALSLSTKRNSYADILICSCRNTTTNASPFHSENNYAFT